MKIVADRKKTSPFECGFDIRDTSRKPFSIRFFRILIIFLVFDVELVILIRTPLSKIYSETLS